MIEQEMRSASEKAAYDRQRRLVKGAELRAYDAIRNAERRKDPAYNAAQLERKRVWREANRERYLAVSRVYEAKQLAENAQRRLSKNLRHRLRKAMIGETKGVSAVTALGIPVLDFRHYIESKFSAGMSWANYGEWHLDHIKPLKSFDLTDNDQLAAACHYTNLQPLWAADNQKKWCKV